MKELLFFVLGILFIEFFIPIIEAFTIVVVAWLEKFKAKSSFCVAKSNVEIQKLTEEEEPPRRVIGFQLPEEDYEEEEDEE